jgi:aspartyl protease family protein
MLFLIVLALIGAAGFALTLPSGAPLLAGLEPGEAATAAMYGALALAIASGLIARYRGRLASGLLAAVAWIGIFAVFIIGFSYRYEIAQIADRVRAELDPGQAVSTSPGEAKITRGYDGQFVLRMKADGVQLPFVFDTGATSVVLKADDATKLGIDVDNLKFDAEIQTANGRALAADTELDSLEIGGIIEHDVDALIAKPGTLRENLLGQSFLDRLQSYTVEKDQLILRSK